MAVRPRSLVWNGSFVLGGGRKLTNIFFLYVIVCQSPWTIVWCMCFFPDGFHFLQTKHEPTTVQVHWGCTCKGLTVHIWKCVHPWFQPTSLERVKTWALLSMPWRTWKHGYKRSTIMERHWNINIFLYVQCVFMFGRPPVGNDRGMWKNQYDMHSSRNMPAGHSSFSSPSSGHCPPASAHGGVGPHARIGHGNPSLLGVLDPHCPNHPWPCAPPGQCHPAPV